MYSQAHTLVKFSDFLLFVLQLFSVCTEPPTVNKLALTFQNFQSRYRPHPQRIVIFMPAPTRICNILSRSRPQIPLYGDVRFLCHERSFHWLGKNTRTHNSLSGNLVTYLLLSHTITDIYNICKTIKHGELIRHCPKCA